MIVCKAGAEEVNVTEVFTDPTAAVIVAVPWAPAVTSPVVETVATALLEVDHAADPVSSCVEPSLNVPVSVSCAVSPEGAEGFAGVMASDTSTGDPAVNVTEFAIAPSVAVIVAVPDFFAVTMPEGETVAVIVSEEDQLTVDVKSCVEPSEKCPVAVSCAVSPAGAEGFAGAREIDCKVAAVTVSVAPLLVVPL